MKKFEIELVSREVALITGSLRLHAQELPTGMRDVYERLAVKMDPTGLYQFDLFEASLIYFALSDYCEVIKALQGEQRSRKIKVLADEFLQNIFMEYPLEEIRNVHLSQERMDMSVA